MGGNCSSAFSNVVHSSSSHGQGERPKSYTGVPITSLVSYERASLGAQHTESTVPTPQEQAVAAAAIPAQAKKSGYIDQVPLLLQDVAHAWDSSKAPCVDAGSPLSPLPDAAWTKQLELQMNRYVAKKKIGKALKKVAKYNKREAQRKQASSSSPIKAELHVGSVSVPANLRVFNALLSTNAQSPPHYMATMTLFLRRLPSPLVPSLCSRQLQTALAGIPSRKAPNRSAKAQRTIWVSRALESFANTSTTALCTFLFVRDLVHRHADEVTREEVAALVKAMVREPMELAVEEIVSKIKPLPRVESSDSEDGKEESVEADAPAADKADTGKTAFADAASGATAGSDGHGGKLKPHRHHHNNNNHKDGGSHQPDGTVGMEMSMDVWVDAATSTVATDRDATVRRVSAAAQPDAAPHPAAAAAGMKAKALLALGKEGMVGPQQLRMTLEETEGSFSSSSSPSTESSGPSHTPVVNSKAPHADTAAVDNVATNTKNNKEVKQKSGVVGSKTHEEGSTAVSDVHHHQQQTASSSGVRSSTALTNSAGNLSSVSKMEHVTSTIVPPLAIIEEDTDGDGNKPRATHSGEKMVDPGHDEAQPSEEESEFPLAEFHGSASTRSSSKGMPSSPSQRPSQGPSVSAAAAGSGAGSTVVVPASSVLLTVSSTLAAVAGVKAAADTKPTVQAAVVTPAVATSTATSTAITTATGHMRLGRGDGASLDSSSSSATSTVQASVPAEFHRATDDSVNEESSGRSALRSHDTHSTAPLAPAAVAAAKAPSGNNELNGQLDHQQQLQQLKSAAAAATPHGNAIVQQEKRSNQQGKPSSLVATPATYNPRPALNTAPQQPKLSALMAAKYEFMRGYEKPKDHLKSPQQQQQYKNAKVSSPQHFDPNSNSQSFTDLNSHPQLEHPLPHDASTGLTHHYPHSVTVTRSGGAGHSEGVDTASSSRRLYTRQSVSGRRRSEETATAAEDDITTATATMTVDETETPTATAAIAAATEATTKQIKELQRQVAELTTLVQSTTEAKEATRKESEMAVKELLGRCAELERAHIAQQREGRYTTAQLRDLQYQVERSQDDQTRLRAQLAESQCRADLLRKALATETAQAVIP